MDIFLQMSAWFLLILIMIGLVVALYTVITQMKWMVPFVPTPKPIIEKMIDFAELKPGFIVLDLGAGDGRILLAAEKREPSIHAIGYEGALMVWMLSWIRMHLRRSHVTMMMKDFMKEDFRQADVIFTYLSMAMMKKLKPKFDAELKPGARVISHAFRIPDMVPLREELLRMPVWGQSRVFCYEWPERQLIINS